MTAVLAPVSETSRIQQGVPSCKPPAPREHGAWGILLIPFATAVGVAGTWNLPLALLLVSVLCFYLARTSWLKKNVPWTVGLLAGSVVAAVPLFVFWKLWWLMGFGLAAAPLAFRKTERSVAMQLLAVAGLTLTAPAAWYAATGQLDYRLWLLNGLYFAGGILYVKMHLAAAMARRPAGRTPVWIYYGALSVVAVLWWPVGAAFGPGIARAVVGVGRLSPVLRIKRLGWTEVAHSLVFGALVVYLLKS